MKKSNIHRVTMEFQQPSNPKTKTVLMKMDTGNEFLRKAEAQLQTIKNQHSKGQPIEKLIAELLKSIETFLNSQTNN